MLSVQNEAGISKRRDKGKEPSSRQNLRNKESAKKFIANMEKRDEKLEKIQDVRVREVSFLLQFRFWYLGVDGLTMTMGLPEVLGYDQ